MAFTLTAIIVSICVIDAYVIGHWACSTTITPLKDKETPHAIARVIAFVLAFALIGLCWFLFTHQVFPQWSTQQCEYCLEKSNMKTYSMK